MVEVTPKAFKINGIRRLPPADTSTDVEPSSDGAETMPGPRRDQIDTTIKFPRYTIGKISDIVVSIIEASSGITARETNELLKKYMKRCRIYNPPDLSHDSYISGTLRNLVKNGRLTRIKINDVYHYYLKV